MDATQLHSDLRNAKLFHEPPRLAFLCCCAVMARLTIFRMLRADGCPYSAPAALHVSYCSLVLLSVLEIFRQLLSCLPADMSAGEDDSDFFTPKNEAVPGEVPAACACILHKLVVMHNPCTCCFRSGQQRVQLHG